MLMANGIVPRPVVPFYNPVAPRAAGSSMHNEWEAEIQNLEVRTLQPIYKNLIVAAF